MYLYLKGIFSTQPNSWVLCFPSSTWQYLSFNWRAESIYFQWMYRCSWIEVYQLASCFCLICLIFSSFLKKFIHNTLLLRLLSVVNYLLKELRKKIFKVFDITSGLNSSCRFKFLSDNIFLPAWGISSNISCCVSAGENSSQLLSKNVLILPSFFKGYFCWI